MNKRRIQEFAIRHQSLANYSQWTTFQISLLALLATGVFMIISADEMGGLGPILLSFGICVVFFVLVCEILVATRMLVRYLIIRLSSYEEQKL